MGPHIKRARIVLVLIGVLYVVNGYLNYDDVARLRQMTRGSGLAEVERAQTKTCPLSGERDALREREFGGVVQVLIARCK